MSWAIATSSRGATSKQPATSRACAARDPSFAWVHFNRGLALAKAGRLLDAQDSYDTALGIETDFAEALVNRAYVELELNQLDALATTSSQPSSSARATWASLRPWAKPGAVGPRAGIRTLLRRAPGARPRATSRPVSRGA